VRKHEREEEKEMGKPKKYGNVRGREGVYNETKELGKQTAPGGVS
jgi:hypothetical protein